MKYFLDTEFLEDGKTIELISIGIVAEDGREFHAVSDEVESGALHDRICKHEWLMNNVVPHLPLRARRGGAKAYRYHTTGSIGSSFFSLDLDSNLVMPRRMIRNGVRDFLQADNEPDTRELWAWYGAYDHVALTQLFGRLIDLPPGIPMWTNDLRQEAQRLGNPKLPEQPAGEHNALEDARHLKIRADWLSDYATRTTTDWTATEHG